MKHYLNIFLLVLFFIGIISCSDIDKADSLYKDNHFKEAAELYKKAADQGDGYAMWRLSGLYITGRGVDYSEAKALKLLRESAEVGCEKAICDTLRAHIHGFYHLKKDPQSVLDKYVKFAEQSKDPYVQARYAALYYNGVEDLIEKDQDRAEKILNEIQDKSEDEYLRTMGFIFCNGTLQTEINEAKAIEFWEKCKNYYKIGQLYEHGGSQIKADIDKAVEYYKKGIECESSISMCNLARIYSSESTDSVYGEYRDIKSAERLLQNAIKHGSGDACDILGSWYTEGTNVAIDEKKAFEYFKKGYEYGSANSALNAGTSYLMGVGCKKNVQKGIECWEYAAELGNSEAAYRMFTIYVDEAIGVDIDKAKHYLVRAAKLENATACFDLGRNYYYGSSICDENIPLAFTYIKKAADLGHHEACAFVAYMYKNGQGCERNLKLQKKYEKKFIGE